MIADTIMRCRAWMSIRLGMIMIAARWRRLSMVAVGIIHSLLFGATASRWHSLAKSKSLKFYLSRTRSKKTWNRNLLPCAIYSKWKFCSLTNFQALRLPLFFNQCFNQLFFRLLSITMFFFHHSRVSFFPLVRDCCCIVVYVLPSSMSDGVASLHECVCVCVGVNVFVICKLQLHCFKVACEMSV